MIHWKKMWPCLLLITGMNLYAQEQLLGVSLDSQGITYTVASNGCTAKEDFGLIMLTTVPVRVLLTREREDTCDAVVPFGTAIKFTYEELGLAQGEEFNLVNALATFKVTQTQGESKL